MAMIGGAALCACAALARMMGGSSFQAAGPLCSGRRLLAGTGAAKFHVAFGRAKGNNRKKMTMS
jgi:hypothetical protein